MGHLPSSQHCEKFRYEGTPLTVGDLAPASSTSGAGVEGGGCGAKGSGGGGAVARVAALTKSSQQH